MPTTIRLGTCSPATADSSAATLALVSDFAQRASAKNVDILLFPEAFLGSGYPRGEDFGCAIGSRTPAGRDAFLSYFRRAVDFGDTVGEAGAGGGRDWIERRGVFSAGDGAGGSSSSISSSRSGGGSGAHAGDGTRETLEQIARKTGVFLVAGAIERAGGSLYCSVVYVCPKLGVVGKRRKVQPTGSERLVWAAAGPATLRAVSTEIRGVRINLAAAICWENYMPLVRQALYAQNVNLYLAPTADGRDAWLGLLRTIGTEGRCFVVSSNMCTEPDGNSPAPTAPAASTFDLPIASAPSANGHVRRESIVHDEDGNEIVLPDSGKPSKSTAAATTSVKTTPSAPAPSAPTGPAESKLSRLTTRGGSAIVSPFGDVVAGPQWGDDQGIVTADVDFDDCIRGRLDLDVGGSYSRNDSFKFSVEGLDLSPLPY